MNNGDCLYILFLLNYKLSKKFKNNFYLLLDQLLN